MDTAQNQVRLNTKQLLEKRNLTPYRIWKESKLARATVYALAKNKGERADFHTLGVFVNTVERLSGVPVTPNDLLEVIPEKTEPKKINAKLEAVLKNAKPPMTAEMLNRKFAGTEAERIAFQAAMDEIQAEKDAARGKVSEREQEFLAILGKKSK